MPDHYHLMVQTPDANISRCVRHLIGIYTQKYNMAHDCDGQLFPGSKIDFSKRKLIKKYQRLRGPALRLDRIISEVIR
jgi:REP element-mobilizing transposase RayT